MVWLRELTQDLLRTYSDLLSPIGMLLYLFLVYLIENIRYIIEYNKGVKEAKEGDRTYSGLTQDSLQRVVRANVAISPPGAVCHPIHHQSKWSR